jgi:8-oxo-dGTP diphosphatase
MRAKFPIAVHLFFIRNDQILMLRRYQTGYMDGYYSVPAGHLDGEEKVRNAGAREAQEEIGVRVDPEQMEFAGVFHRREDSERVDFFFQVLKWEGEPFNAEPDKSDGICWVDIEHLPENTIPYVRQAIENYRSGVRFAEFGWKAVDTQNTISP